MESAIIYNSIRQTVQACLPGARIMLFGSRARGDHQYDSDYDLLIVTPATFTSQEKIRWSTVLDKAIVKAIQAPVDLVLNSEEEILQKQQLPGNIVRTAVREAIAL